MAGTMRKTEFSKLVAKRLGVNQAAGAEATAAVLDMIRQVLEENEKLTLTGFGTFSVKERAARRIRAIRGKDAGEMIDVPPGRYVSFKPGNELTESVRGQK